MRGEFQTAVDNYQKINSWEPVQPVYSLGWPGHPFVDGNKRTAFVAADNLVRDRGYQISATDEEVVSFMLEVAEYKHTRESIEAWLKEKTGL